MGSTDVINMHLKISHRGLMQFFSCPVGTKYEHIIRMAIDRFAINKLDYNIDMLLLTTEHGYVFDKLLFEYFILLFPRPEIVFYLRVNLNPSSKCDETIVDKRQPFGNSKMNTNKNVRQQDHNDNDDDEDDIYYDPVPVHRQNCFWGELPTQSAAQLEQQRQMQFTGQLRRRMRQLNAITPIMEKTKRRAIGGHPPAPKRLRI